ncbi:radical SAM family heme chaperone HemW [Arachidicoccus sp.]|uniref:radical SAM family heme chaperone HemW n=1 Tax=Arachidicoccus sp. TaxID=1872624 RepID=UPI003D2024DA
MAGIYIHIPYCKKACHYCNFHFSTTKYTVSEMLQSIRQEAVLRRNYLNETVHTVYFGGGTPSMVSPLELQLVLEKIQSLFTLDAQAEITLEANPDDISKDNLIAWKSAGFNRLSIGVQSFYALDLEWMNRSHNVTQALESIELAQAHGFENISIDLIYGTPLLTDELWRENLKRVAGLNIVHLSAYALTVEPKTALAKMIAKEKVSDIQPQKQVAQFDILMQWASANNFEHYEISNFAKPGFRSKHNSNYWLGTAYLGLGPSAHSFDGSTRQWNIANNALYLQSLKKQLLNYERETLSRENKINEMLMISLRTIEGIDLKKMEVLYGRAEKDRVKNLAKKWIDRQYLYEKDNHLMLTSTGKHYADGIAADLFSTSD